MNIVLWVVQGVLALGFVLAGFPKVTQPIPALAKRLPWAAELPEGVVRFIGGAEVLGGVGLIVPRIVAAFASGFSGAATVLTIAAAIGLALVMVLAAGFHLRRNEAARIAPNLVLLILAALVVVGRLTFAQF